MPHVFDYTEEGTEVSEGVLKIKDTPIRYVNNRNTSTPIVSGTWVNYGAEGSSVASSTRCLVETTYGDIIFSDSVMMFQKSCEPHAYNAGNYYNLPNQLDSAGNTVCPHGWSLPPNSGYSDLTMTYGFLNATSYKSSGLKGLPLSFLQSGWYSGGLLNYVSTYGYYRTYSFSLEFEENHINPSYGLAINNGGSIRCLVR